MSLKVPVNATYHEIINESAKAWENKRDANYHNYRKKWSSNPKNFILEEAPLHLDIEPTNRCNLKCPMCPRTVLLENDDNNFLQGVMDFSLYKKIIDEAVDIGVYSIKLNWLGEPLVHPQLCEMVSYAKKRGIIDVMFNTNGVLVTEEVIIRLIEAGLDKIFFSFDSPFKDEYEKIRIGARYDEVLANIKKVSEIKQRLGVDYPLTRVSMVLEDNKKYTLQEYTNLFKDIVDVVAYVDYRSPEGNATNRIFDFACSQLWQRMIVAWDGEVTVCCVDSKKEYIVGHLTKNSLKEIWTNEKYDYIRSKHRLGKYYDIEMCRKCELPLRAKDGSV